MHTIAGTILPETDRASSVVRLTEPLAKPSVDSMSINLAGMAGEAFGIKQPTQSLATHRPEPRSDEFVADIDAASPFPEVLPEIFHESAYIAVFTAGQALADWHLEELHAQGMIVSHAANDLRLLLVEVIAGEGRSAARTARSLYEHLINLHHVNSSAERAERYRGHASVTAQSLVSLRSGFELLSTKVRKREQALLNRLSGRTRKDYETARMRWPGYTKGWSDRTLFDMAKLAGLDQDYDVYRVLSAVTHGNAGGARGTMREVRGATVHRFGPDMDLVPLAFFHGLTWWLAFIDLMPRGVRTDAARIAGKDLLAQYEVLLETSRMWDRKVWPTEPPDRHEAIAVIYPTGKMKWFVHNTVEQSMVLGDAIEPLPPFVQANLDRLRDQARSRQYANVGGRPLSIRCLGVAVKPKLGATPVHSSAILIPHEFMKPGRKGKRVSRLSEQSPD